MIGPSKEVVLEDNEGFRLHLFRSSKSLVERWGVEESQTQAVALGHNEAELRRESSLPQSPGRVGRGLEDVFTARRGPGNDERLGRRGQSVRDECDERIDLRVLPGRRVFRPSQSIRYTVAHERNLVERENRFCADLGQLRFARVQNKNRPRRILQQFPDGEVMP